MRIEERPIIIREIIADNGKMLRRKDTESYFSKCIMFPEDTEADFEEVDESEVPQPEIMEDYENE